MFKEYENSWLQNTITELGIKYTFSEEILNEITNNYTDYTLESLQSRYFQKVLNLGLGMGDNVIVALSGGVDSQTVCLSLKQVDIPFKAVTMVMKDNFNDFDVKSAHNFCKKHKIEHIIIEIDIINFLTKKLWEYSEKYQCPSPQFCSHFWFYEKVLELYNPSCLIIGGTAPRIIKNEWHYMLTTSQISWRNFRKLHQCNMIGDFFSYSFDLSLLHMMTRKNNEIIAPNMDYYQTEIENYKLKIQGLQLAGFDVLPQFRKYTGFEKLKKYFNELTGNDTAFNTRFRRPLESKFANYKGKLYLPAQATFCLNEVYFNINTP
jgi:hypothetical protein